MPPKVTGLSYFVASLGTTCPAGLHLGHQNEQLVFWNKGLDNGLIKVRSRTMRVLLVYLTDTYAQSMITTKRSELAELFSSQEMLCDVFQQFGRLEGAEAEQIRTDRKQLTIP